MIRRHKSAASQFIMICIIHKIPVLLKITRISKRFIRNIIDFFFFQENN